MHGIRQHDCPVTTSTISSGDIDLVLGGLFVWKGKSLWLGVGSSSRAKGGLSGPGHWHDPARVIGLQLSGLGHWGGPVPAALE